MARPARGGETARTRDFDLIRGYARPCPALIESMAGPDAVCVREMIEGLKADHRALEAAWRRLRGVLEKIAAGESVPLVPDDVETLVGVYERHIKREECELLPMASRLLGEEDLARIGRAMRERRGIGEV